MRCDLNVPWSEDAGGRLPGVLRTLEQLGYDAAALAHTSVGIPRVPCAVRAVPGSRLRQYTRLTVVLGDPGRDAGATAPGAAEAVASYDIVAVAPTTEKAFAAVCTGPLAAGGRSFDPDIVSLDVCASRLSLGVRPGLLRLAAKRGLFFELVYAPIVADANARKTAAANVRTLLRYGLKSILVCGGVDAAWKARAPADVANLLALVGVAPDAARRAMTAAPEAVVLHAASRVFAPFSAVIPESDQPAGHEDLLSDFISLK